MKQLRILVVEDEMTIALLLEDMLDDLGHKVVGLALRFGQAVKLATDAQADFAILDVNLNGQMSFPVAELLESRGIPFVFATGYGSAGVEASYRGRGMVIKKPFDLKDLRLAIERVAPEANPVA
jgi:DNA-binding NtrC family response regulator